MPIKVIEEQNKVVLTQEQARAIECIREQKTLPDAVGIHAYDPTDWAGTFSKASTLSLDTFIRALYIGYEVEQTVEEQLLEEVKLIQERMAFASDELDVKFWSGRYGGIMKVLDIIGMKVKGINA